MKNIILFLSVFSPLFSIAQTPADSILKESLDFQTEMNSHYGNADDSPLTPEDLAHFTALPFFEIDTAYYVTARFERAKKSRSIKLKTSTDRKPKYEIYGTVFFNIHGTEYSLKVYQSHRLREIEKYENSLFLPFLDLTNGTDSYGGGRYIDIEIPEGSTMVINFNLAYNPYCAYSGRYSCPIVPEENFVNLEIRAGVMAPKSH